MNTANAPEQPLPDSGIEDRIASIFGGNSPKPPEPEDSQQTAAASEEQPEGYEPPAEETFELDIDGEKFVLPKKLEKGFLQERDYTQKSQTLADQRRTLEHVQQQMRVAQMEQQFHQAIADEQKQMQMLDYMIAQRSQQNWAQMSTDEILRARLELDQLRDQKGGLEKQIGEKQQQFQAQQQQELAKLQAQSLDVVKKHVPGWNEQVAKDVREHALSQGYTEAELSAIYDPRHAVTLWKAAQYDKARSNAQPAVAQAKAAKVSSTNPMPQHVKNQLNFRKAVAKTEGNPQARKQVVEARIADIFAKR